MTLPELIAPHGGRLVNLLAPPQRAAELRQHSRDWPSWDLTPRQFCDLELLLSGGFSPLESFLGRADYDAVLANRRLASGVLWPIPVVLDLPEERAAKLAIGDSLGLRDPEGVLLARLEISELYRPDRMAEAERVYATTSREHPGVAELLDRTNPVCVSGRLEGLEPPTHHDFRELRLTPQRLREDFARRGWSKIVAFQTRNPMHRAHVELCLRAAREAGASLLVHPSVGMTAPGDVDHYTRVRCYEALLHRLAPETTRLALLPLAMRMAGPREALWHAIIRKNHGCTHFIVGRDHAGPGKDSAGQAYYGAYEAQELVTHHAAELGIGVVPFRNMVYLEDRDAYAPEDEVPEGAKVLSLSGTELRQRLASGREIPTWFTYPEVAQELARRHPPKAKRGFTVFFTGLSGAGKSTIARVLQVKFLAAGGRPVSLLDGDIVRKNLSSELGFSREHRNLNVRRIGFVAAEITKNGGIALCAPIAPYDDVRKDVRREIEARGGFVLVHVATPIEICEARDRKGLYAKARAGLVPSFTGVSDPYEAPTDAEVVVDGDAEHPEEAAQRILDHLEREGYLVRGEA